MPRKNRQESPTGIYHWISRGYLKKNIFRHKDDFQKFLELIKEYKETHSITIYHYCLMHNHAHLLVHAKSKADLSLFSHFVKRRYAYYYSKTYLHAGPSFEKRFIGIPVTDETYLLECGRYIERNPIRAGLVKNPGDYFYSSHSWYISQFGSDILTTSPAVSALSENQEGRIQLYERYVTEVRPQEEFAPPLLKI